MRRIEEIMRKYDVSRPVAEVILRTEQIRGYQYEKAEALILFVRMLEAMMGMSYAEAVDMKEFVEKQISHRV